MKSFFENVRPAVHLIVGTLMLSLALRTWLIMGWIEPVEVAGSSMAPHLRGQHFQVFCPECSALYEVGAEYGASALVCAHCSSHDLERDSSVQRGDRLWVDRTAFEVRRPHRWEVVILRDPTDCSQLCVKRIVGLPGEEVVLRHGDVWIDGKPAVKSFDQQLEVRVPVTLDEQLVTDALPYNAGLSRRVEPVHDIMAKAMVHVAGPGSVDIVIDQGTGAWRGKLEFPELSWKVRRGATEYEEIHSPQGDHSASRKYLLEVSRFDGHVLLVLDGNVVFQERLASDYSAEGGPKPLTLESQGQVQLSETAYFRDIHYLVQRAGAQKTVQFPMILGPEEYFLLGDNSAVSIDSREWGPVSSRFLVGKPVLDR